MCVLAVLSDIPTRYLAAGGHNVVFDETITFWDKKLWDNKVQITVEDSDTFSNDTLGDGEVDVDQLRWTGKLKCMRMRIFASTSLSLSGSLPSLADTRALARSRVRWLPPSAAGASAFALPSPRRPVRDQTPNSSVPLCLDFCVFYILLCYSL